MISPQIRGRVRPVSPAAAQRCHGKRLAPGHGMAIMWDPPAERPSLEPTPAELAWKQWLMEALAKRNGDDPGPGERSGQSGPPPETLTPAA